MNIKSENLVGQNEYFGWSDFHGLSEVIQILLPEITLSIFAMIALLGAVYGGKDKVSSAVLWCIVTMFSVIAIYVSLQGGETLTAFGGAFIDDPYSRFLKVVILLSASAVLIMSQEFLKLKIDQFLKNSCFVVLYLVFHASSLSYNLHVQGNAPKP